MLELPVMCGDAKGLRERALDALAGDGGVASPSLRGPSPSGTWGDFCVRARDLHVGFSGVLGADDDLRASASLGVDVDAWRSTRANVVQSMSSRDSAGVDQFASAGSSLLQQRHSSVASFNAAAGSSCLAPHIHCNTVRHWFGVVKNNPAVSLLLRVLSPGSPVYVTRLGGFVLAACIPNHLSVTSRTAVFDDTVCTDVIHERALNLDSRFAADILGLRVSPLAVVLEPKFRIIDDLTFARAGVGTSVKDETDLPSAPPCELGHVLVDVLLRVLVCNSGTVVPPRYYRSVSLVSRRCPG